MAEMLLQSHTGTIVLLPALPNVWEHGAVTGLRARGGFEVDISWEDHALKEVHLKSLNGNRCSLRYAEKQIEFETKKGEKYTFNGQLN
jgi:alpha-L-fucosidase 2